MTILYTDFIEGVQTTSSTTFVVMRSKEFTLDYDGADYRIILTCEFTINNKNDRAELEVLLDGVQVDSDSFSPTANTNEPHKFMTMILAEQTSDYPLNSGSHTLVINARSVNGNTVSVRRVRLSVDKY